MKFPPTVCAFLLGLAVLLAQVSSAEELYVRTVVDFLDATDTPINSLGAPPENGGNGWTRVENLVSRAYQQQSSFESLSASGVEISTIRIETENTVLSNRVDGSPVTTLSYEPPGGGGAAVTFLHQDEVIARGEYERFDIIYSFNVNENLSLGTIRLISGTESPANPASGFFDEVMSKNNGVIEFVGQPVTAQANGTQASLITGGLNIQTDVLLSVPDSNQSSLFRYPANEQNRCCRSAFQCFSIGYKPARPGTWDVLLPEY